MRREGVAALGHEAHPAEHDQPGVDVARAHRQLERIPDDVGDRLYLGYLVVVGRYEGAFFALEAANLVPQEGHAAGAAVLDLAALYESFEGYVKHRGRSTSGDGGAPATAS